MKRNSIAFQIFCILLIIGFFAGLNLWFYNTYTVRYINDRTKTLRAKSIELNEYLPFVDDTKIVKLDGSLKFSKEDYEKNLIPKIDCAAALYPVTSAFVNAVYPEESVSFDGTDFVSSSCLMMNNTISAYKEVVDGDADIVICAPPSEEQISYAENQGVELVYEPIGKEAFVFLVNEHNQVDNVSLDELQRIYTGEIKNWSELGGENKQIEPIQRNEGSGSQTMFLKIMGDKTPMRAYIGLPGSAIGFSFRYYVEEVIQNGGVKVLSINGYSPTKENIVSDQYPFVAEFFAVYRKDNQNENVGRFVEWMKSAEGQKIIEDTGYISLYD